MIQDQFLTATSHHANQFSTKESYAQAVTNPISALFQPYFNGTV